MFFECKRQIRADLGFTNGQQDKQVASIAETALRLHLKAGHRLFSRRMSGNLENL